jgi:hypothetical protein
VTVTARQFRKEQLHSGKAVRTGVTRRGFDTQRNTDDEAEAATGCNELEGATHDELPSSLRRRRGGYGAASQKKGGEAKAKVRTDLD